MQQKFAMLLLSLLWNNVRSYCVQLVHTTCVPSAANKSSLSCDFEDPFVCGYTTTTVNEVSWERVDRNGLNQSESDEKTGVEELYSVHSD
jgi:hypothetical protein